MQSELFSLLSVWSCLVSQRQSPLATNAGSDGNTYMQIGHIANGSFTQAGSNSAYSICLKNGNFGVATLNPSYPLDVVGDINTSTDYNINGTQVLNSSTLGTGVINSSLRNLGTQNSSLNMGGNSITNTSSITATNLTGTLQTASQPNITSLGTLTSLNVSGDLTVDGSLLNVDSVGNNIGINKQWSTIS